MRNLLPVFLLIGLPLLALIDLRSYFLEPHESLENPGIQQRNTVAIDRSSSDFSPSIPQPVPLAQTDWFLAFRQEIRRLGAVHIKVERVKGPGNGQIYHFRCRFQAAGQENAEGKQIESLSRSARSAAEQVLRDARIWYRRNKPLVSKS